jgi:hypothetical protein
VVNKVSCKYVGNTSDLALLIHIVIAAWRRKGEELRMTDNDIHYLCKILLLPEIKYEARHGGANILGQCLV